MKYQNKMAHLGFHLVGTGGGCDAYILEADKSNDFNIERCIVITGYMDSNIPTRKSQKISVGFYSKGWGEQSDFEMVCKFGDLLSGKVKLCLG